MVNVQKLDRNNRDKYDNATIKQELIQNGVKLISVTKISDGSHYSVIIESLLEGMSEYYSKHLYRRGNEGKHLSK